MLITALKAFGALVLLTITLLRLPVAFDRSRSHAAWIGTLLGTLALSINDFVITEHEIDALLGGSNWFHLVRNVLVLGAMWALRVALLEAVSQRPWSRQRKRAEAVVALVVIAVMTLSFWLVDRSGTSMAFIPEHIDQLPTLIYGAVYMATAAALMFDTAWRVSHDLRNTPQRQTRVKVSMFLVCIGALSMAVASVIECFYMTADHLYATDGPFIAITYAAFGPLYLSGAALLAVGLLLLAVSAAIRRWSLGDRYYLSRLGALRRPELSGSISTAARSSDPRSDLYKAMIAVYDARARGDLVPDPKRDKVLEAVEARFGE